MKPQPIITKALASKAKTSSSKSSPAEKSKSPNLGRIVARRILKENTRKGGGIEALIGTPYPDGKHWACPFYIDGLDMDGVQKGMGEDSLQALLSAIAGVRAMLERSGRKFFWLDSELGAFIPLFVSQRGKHFEQRIKAAMIREIKRDSYLEIERRGKLLEETSGSISSTRH